MSPRLTFLFALPFLVFACKPASKPTPSPAPLSETSLKIPLLPKPDPETWPTDAYQVQVLHPRPAQQAPNSSRLALAWEPDGLRIWAEVLDVTPVEGEDKTLWTGDSLEFFIASPLGSGNWLQLVCSPGRSAEHPKPRWTYIDRQKGNGVLQDPVVHVTPLDQGYLLSLFFPWSNLISPPGEGEQIGLQIYLNDVSPAGKTRMVWFPSEEKQGDPKNYYPVQLAREASQPQTVVASLELEKLRDIVINVIGSPDLVGKEIALRFDTESSWTKIGSLPTAVDGLSTFSLPLPPSSAQNAELKMGDLMLPAMKIPDIATARLKVLRSSDVLAKPSIFDSKALPPVDFRSREMIDAVFGPCNLKVRYFNSAYEEVQSATETGRYGALVEITTADGLTDIRRLTLFHTAQRYVPRVNGYDLSYKFPPQFGLPADITQREALAAGEFLNSQLQALAGNNGQWAILPAGLHDLATDPKKWHGFDLWHINQEWWHGLDRKLGINKPYEYLLYLPEEYKTEESKQWPLVIFLHGSGERGRDLELLKKNGLPKLVAGGKTFPFIIASPQCPTGESWGSFQLNELVDKLAEEYRVDPKRIYLTGLSMGGYGSWNLAAHYPGKYAALAPICGGAQPDLAPRLKTIPIWAFHGGNDETVPPQSSQGIVKALQQIGGKARITLYPGVGHDSWTQAYDDPDLYTWLLQQSLK